MTVQKFNFRGDGQSQPPNSTGCQELTPIFAQHRLRFDI